jgi:AcrR family transcriptional regulator
VVDISRKKSGVGRRLPVLEEFDSCSGERSDAADNRRRILSAARKLFEEKGVEGVSMAEIGRVAGVGQGTLYRRYEHKGALCAALLRNRMAQFTEETRPLVEDENEPALGRLVRFLERLARFTEEDAPLLAAVRNHAGSERRSGSRSGAYRSPFYGWLRAAVSALLVRAVERGEARPDLDVELTADAVLAPLAVDLYLFQRHELGVSHERIVGALRSFVLDGVRSGPRDAGRAVEGDDPG